MKNQVKNLKWTLLAVVGLLLIAGGCGRDQQVRQGPDYTVLEQALVQRLDQLREESGFPGATCAVVMPDQTLIRIAVGQSDPDTGTLMTPDARIFTGSAGKTFFSAALLQLMEEDRLGLDEPISNWFGDEPWFPRLPNNGDLTVRMLMNHTGGLPRWILDPEIWEGMLANPDRMWSPEERLAYVLDKEPVHEAGKMWYYSDTDYILLAMIMERASGNDAYTEIDRRFLKPLKLTCTAPSLSRDIENLPQGCSGPTGDMTLPDRVVADGHYMLNPQLEWGGGGFVTNSGDLAQWAFHLYRGDILKPETMAQLLSPVGKDGMPSETGYGLGVMVRETPGGLSYGHGGIFPGYQTAMGYFPEIDCSLAVQVNADRFSGKLKKSPDECLGELAVLVRDAILKEK